MSLARVAKENTETKAGPGLRIGAAHDHFEREADRMADEISTGGAGRRQWQPASLNFQPTIQRSCGCGGSGGADGECEECREKNLLQRSPSGPGTPGMAPPMVHQVLKSPGRPMAPATRSFMESRFGYNFSGVRIFHDDTAAASARSVAANAYTVGQKIVFNQGKYAPDSQSGRRLLAHELTHVVQQSRGGMQPKASGEAALEGEAGHLSRRVEEPGTRLNVRQNSGVGIARDPASSERQLIEVHLPEGTKQLTPEEFAEYKRRSINNLRADLRRVSGLADNGRQSQESMLAEYQGGVESFSDIWKKPKALIGIAADIKAGVTPPYIGAWSHPKRIAESGIAACNAGNLGEAARLLKQADADYRDAIHAWNAYREATIGGAEAVASDLETVRDVSFAIALVAGAAVAAPVIAAGVAGLGATGATATVLTAGGTAIVTGTGGAVLGGGSTAVASLAATGKVDTKAVKRDAIKFGKQGVVTGLTAGLGSSLAAAGTGAKLAQPLVQSAARRCLTEAGVNLAGEVTTQALDAALSDKSTQAAAQEPEGRKPVVPGPARAALTGCLSGVLGVPVAKLGATGRKTSELAVGAGVGYVDARLSGQSNKEALLAAGQNVLTSAAVAHGHAGTEQAKTKAKATAAPVHEAVPAGTGHPGEPTAKPPAEKFLEKQKAATGEHEGPPAVIKEEAKAKKATADGHEAVVTEHGIGKCSPSPCPVIHLEYAQELKQNPELQQWEKTIRKLRKSDPARAAAESAKLIGALEEARAGGGKTPAASSAQHKETALDARIALAEAELNPARQKTLKYQEERTAAGENLKGGPSKKIWNVKESLWIAKRQKAYPDRTILEQPRIVGVKGSDGKVTTSKSIAGSGRIPDYVEFRGSKVVAGDIKSAEEFLGSVAGGLKGNDARIEAEFLASSKIGKQHGVEGKVLETATKGGGKIVIEGRDVITGQKVRREVDPKDFGSEVVSYEQVQPN